MEKRYFGTDGIRGHVGEYPITPDFVLKLGWAVGKVLADEGGGNVLIGKDTRISGYMFESALEAGLSAAGVNIHLLGPMPTPAIAYLTRTLRARAGIVISASHNPYTDNGIKFFSSEGTKLPDALEKAIEVQLDQPMQVKEAAQLGKALRIVDAAGRYIEFCKSTITSRTNLRGLKIVVDCAHGATYHIAPNVLRELGAEVHEIHVSPDGFNINENCGSTKPSLLQKCVLEEKADLGIAYDGDGDRVIMVDDQGEIVDGDELLFIIAKYLAGLGRLRGGIVGTVMSNLGLENALKQLGVVFVRCKVGDRYVLQELQDRNWWLGGESSGHIIWREATTTGDGIIASLQVLAAMSSTQTSLHTLKKGMKKFPQAVINVKLVEENNALQLLEMPQVQSMVSDVENQLRGRGRVLLRPSGTESLIRVMVEGEDHQEVHFLANQVASTIEQVIAS